MKPIDILGVKNFRIFDDKDGMFTEMAGINLVTGANNTGKSSITKLLQMVRNSMNGHLFPFDLDLTEQEHLLGDFNNLLHNKNNKQVNISLPFTFFGLTKLYVSLTFNVSDDDSYKAKLRAIEVKDYSAKGYSTLFSFVYRAATQDEKKAQKEQFKKDRKKYEKEKKIADKKREESIAKGEEYNAFLNHGFLMRPMENPLDSFVEWTINTKMLKNYLDQLLKIYKLYENYNRNFDWLEHIDKLADEAAIHFIPSTFINSFKGPLNLETWQEFINKNLTGEVQEGKSEIGEYDFEIDDIFDARLDIEHLLYSKSLDILKNQLSWNEFEPKSNDFTYNVIANCFETSWKNLANRISSIHIISALREENSRGYSTTTNTPFTTLLKNFDSLKGEYNDFIEKYLIKFEIGKKIEVEHLLSYQLMKASIKTLNGETRELVDFGSGIKQLILILMQISVLSKKNELRNHIYDYRGDGEMIKINYRPSILVIEEPENYLHPKWQSILAEMFLDASEKYNIQLIIETHSEYLIRNFQNQVAEKKLREDKIKIFYLRDKNYVKEGKEQLQTINIEKDGSIDYKAFDSGFFDVSDELTLSRLNIHAKQFITEFEQLKQAKVKDDKKIGNLEKAIDDYVKREDMQFFERKVAMTIDISSLKESTVKYISSGQLLIDRIPDSGDFSPVLIQYGRAMENEMKDLFLLVDPVKKWMLGNMQGSLENAINSATEIQRPCTAAQLRILKEDILPEYFRNAENLDIASIDDLRDKRNTAGHPGETKTKDEALDYIVKVTEFLRNWISEKV